MLPSIQNLYVTNKIYWPIPEIDLKLLHIKINDVNKLDLAKFEQKITAVKLVIQIETEHKLDKIFERFYPDAYYDSD